MERTSFSMEQARSRNYIGRRLAEARRERGLSLAALARALTELGVSVGSKGLSKWETGQTVPNAYQLMAACRVLGLGELFSDYAPELNDIGLRKLADYRRDLVASGRYAPELEEWTDMPVYRLAVSAGTGLFLDGDDAETERVPRGEVPDGAAFGLRVSGDSMEPVYHDGQRVWVQPCRSLRPGEIGVFVCDGEGFLKIYGEREPDDPEAFTDSGGVLRRQPVLLSCNPAYPPRPIPADMPFTIVGRAL